MMGPMSAARDEADAPKLELRDLQTDGSLFIEEEGTVLGREGGDAQIKLKDMGVSKRHARIYGRQGEWFVEDLNSSNGTYVDEQRVRGPVQLGPGAVLTLSQQQFEVVQVLGGDQLTRRADMSNPGAWIEESVPVPSERPSEGTRSARPSGEYRLEKSGGGSSKRRAPPVPSEDAPTPPPEPPTAGAEPRPWQTSEPTMGLPQAAALVEKKGVGDFLAAVPKAILYYLRELPRLAVNPIRYVDGVVAEQPMEAMDPVELIAYALPANLFTAAVGFSCLLIAQVVTGTLSLWGVLPLVPLAIAVGASVASGFLLHPVLGWLVKVLKGSSDTRSRTNFFLMMNSAVMLLAVPGGLATLLALVRLPFLNLLPTLLSLAASLILSWIAYRWFTRFQVIQWFRYLILLGGALACVSGAWALVHTTVANLRALGARGEAASAGEPGKATEVAKEGEVAQAERASPAAETSGAAVETEKASEGAKQPVEKPVEAPEGTGVTAGQGGYPAYFAQRQAIEAALAQDPTLLEDKQVLALYRKLAKETFELEQEYSRRSQKEPSALRVNERLKEAALYRRSAKTVAELHARMFH